MTVLEPCGDVPGGQGESDSPHVAAAAKMLACPDCKAEVIVRDFALAMSQVTVVHEVRCPWRSIAALGRRALLVVHRSRETMSGADG